MCQLMGDTPITLIGMAISKSTGSLVSEVLTFTRQGHCISWDRLVQHVPGAKTVWQRLRREIWNGYCISTSLEMASINDILLFLAFLCAHQTLVYNQQNIWVAVGKVMLPLVLHMCGHWVDRLAVRLSQDTIKELPILRNKANRASRALDPVNRMLLLYKLRREKVHRRRVGKTHDGLVPLEGVWARHEACLDVVLHSHALKVAFANHPPQLSISWDPSSYGGKSTNVAVFFSCHLNKGGFLLNQQVARLMHSDVEEEIIKAAKNNKLNRVEGYNELRGFASALYNSTGMSLTDFSIPQGLILRAVGQNEVRVKGRDGKQYLLNTKDNTIKPVIPPQLSMKDVPILHSISDQGPLNMSALSFLSFSRNSLMIHTSWDPYHRGWNDVKGAAKKVSFPAYRCILELVTFFNVNFGPFQSQQWWWRKRAMLEAFLTKETWRGETWNSYVHMIAAEKRMEEPYLRGWAGSIVQPTQGNTKLCGEG